MIDGGPGYLASYDLAPPTPTYSPFPFSKLDRRHTGRLRKRDSLLTEGVGGDGGGAESNGRKKACSSINHTILSEHVRHRPGPEWGT